MHTHQNPIIPPEQRQVTLVFGVEMDFTVVVAEFGYEIFKQFFEKLSSESSNHYYTIKRTEYLFQIDMKESVMTMNLHRQHEKKQTKPKIIMKREEFIFLIEMSVFRNLNSRHLAQITFACSDMIMMRRV